MSDSWDIVGHIVCVNQIDGQELALFDCTFADGASGFFLVASRSLHEPKQGETRKAALFKVFPYQLAKKLGALESATQAMYGERVQQ